MLVFAHLAGYETGENLANALQARMGATVSAGSASKVLPRISRGDIVVRWGCTKAPEYDGIASKVYNHAENISANSNKLNSLRSFGRVGLRVPRIYTNKREIARFPVLGRDTHHYGGKDIVIINGSNTGRNNFDAIPDKDFYVEVIPSRAEYRVHVFLGRVIRITKKVFRGHTRDDVRVAERDIIRNDTFGWGHQNVDEREVPDNIKDAAKRSMAAVGLDFGAADVLIDMQGNPYVLEVNTAPRLGDTGIDLYVSEFMKLVAPKRTVLAGLKNKVDYFWR